METWQIFTIVWCYGILIGYAWTMLDSARCDDIAWFEAEYSIREHVWNFLLNCIAWPITTIMMMYRFATRPFMYPEDYAFMGKRK